MESLIATLREPASNDAGGVCVFFAHVRPALRHDLVTPGTPPLDRSRGGAAWLMVVPSLQRFSERYTAASKSTKPGYDATSWNGMIWDAQ